MKDYSVRLQNFHEISAIYIFADIRGFSSWTRENQTEIKKLLEITYSTAIQLFGPKTHDRYTRRIVKFIGDGFFAVNEYNDESPGNTDFLAKLMESISCMNNYGEIFTARIAKSNLHGRADLGIGFGVTYGFSVRFNLPGYPLDYTGHKVNFCSRLCSLAEPSEMVFERDLIDNVIRIVQKQSPTTPFVKEHVSIRGMDGADIIRVRCYNFTLSQQLKNIQNTVRTLTKSEGLSE